MKTGASSKRAKKSSDEDRSKKKKTKSGRRRRRDPSLSPDSASSSDSDYASRPRRKKPKKLEKRRKEPKKGSKKKARKTRRRSAGSLSGSWSSSSGRSCSTCGGRRGSSSERSASPPARAVRKLKSKERGRSKAKDRGRSRGRSSRRRSDERGSGGRFRSQSCSSRSRSSGRGRSPSRGFSEERCHEVGRPGHLRTAQAPRRVPEEIAERISRRNERRDKVSQGSDVPPSRSREGYDAGRKRVAHRQLSGEKGQVYSWVEGGDYAKGEEAVSARTESRPSRDADDGNDNYAEKGSGAVANTGSSETDDLELLLRQKALENFRKFRGGVSAKPRLDSDQIDDSVSTDSCKDATRVIQAKDATKLSECYPSSYSEDQGSIHGTSHWIQPRLRSVVHVPTENDNGNSVISRQNSVQYYRSVDGSTINGANEGENNQNQLKRTEEPLNGTSLVQNSLAEPMQNNVSLKEPEGNIGHGTEVHKADGSASGSTVHVNRESGNEPVGGDTTGDQFQKKTFSRIHDGEMVQVSYKVYIPKKSPALARRQLQR